MPRAIGDIKNCQIAVHFTQAPGGARAPVLHSWRCQWCDMLYTFTLRSCGSVQLSMNLLVNFPTCNQSYVVDLVQSPPHTPLFLHISAVIFPSSSVCDHFRAFTKLSLERTALFLPFFIISGQLRTEVQTRSYTASPQSGLYLSPLTYSKYPCTCTPVFNLVTLSQLHWLPVHDRIKFKITTMAHKDIYTGNYLANLVQWHTLQNSMVSLCQPALALNNT